ncbi:MAG: hydantoinase/oxoprolinase family protein, partial [Proteobacteria bacterium]|nr:hydantoinase/oxoprolinase family protein [Pseudomonadota bacterium]
AGVDPEAVRNDSLLQYLAQHGPTPPGILAAQTKTSSVILEKRLERLTALQQVVLAGFTPTDALHGLGLLAIGRRESSVSGAEALAGQAGFEDFCRQVVAETEAAIETILLTYLTRMLWQDNASVPLLSQRDNDLFSVRFTVHVPIIGIGAAARCFLPGVAQRLGATLVFPEHCEVGNAVGAALIAMRG